MPSTAKKMIDIINPHTTTSSKGIGTPSDQGIHMQYNGLDVHQMCNYIKLSCETYIDHVLQTHGWETPSAHESNHHDLVLITHDASNALMQLAPGLTEDTLEHGALEWEVRFSYCQVLGELIYAFVVVCIDIGFVIALLSRFVSAPACKHYLALKNVLKYSQHTKHWGILYWQSAPVDLLPAVAIEQPALDPSLPSFPQHSLLQLIGFVVAAYTTDTNTWCSLTGIVFCLASGAITCKSKLQATVTSSSTKAKFITAVYAAKITKYLHVILHEFGIPPRKSCQTHLI